MKTEVDLKQVFRQDDLSESTHDPILSLQSPAMFTDPSAMFRSPLSSLLGFIKILDQMRHGTLDSESISTLKGLSREITYEDGIDPTEL